MTSWFSYSLAAFILMGLQGFLYKVAAERRCDTARTTFIFMAAVALLSFILWAYLRESPGSLSVLIMLAVVNSLTFLAATMTCIEALRYISATTVYSFVRLNLVLVTIFSFVWFDDHLSWIQVAGIGIALCAILALTRGMNPQGIWHKPAKIGFIYAGISLLASTVAAISSKFAAISVGKLPFLAIVYSIAALASLPLARRETACDPKNRVLTIVIGLAMGVLNFFGYYAFLAALSMGPLPLVASITGMHFVVSVVLSFIIYGEKLTRELVIGFFLTMISIILLKL